MSAATPASALAQALVSRLRREVVPGRTTLGELAGLLADTGWPAATDVALVTVIGGKVPLRWSEQDTILALTLPGGCGAVYLALLGRHDFESVVAALCGGVADITTQAAVVGEIAYEVSATATP